MLTTIKWGLFLFALSAASLYLWSGYIVNQINLNYPPGGKFIEIDGLQLHFVDSGERSRSDELAVVLLHGASANLEDFRSNLLPYLQNDYRVIAFDRPGHGFSDRNPHGWASPVEQARLVQAALHSLGVSKAVWVGHSWSGSVVMAALLAYPKQVLGGVLLAGGSHPWEGGNGWHNDLTTQAFIGPIFVNTLVPTVGRVRIDAAIKKVFNPNPVPENHIENTAVKLTLRPESFLNNAEDIVLLSDFLVSQARQYHLIKQPLLLISGEEDSIVPPEKHAEKIVKSVPQANLFYLKNTGHALHHSRTEQVGKRIKDFLKVIQTSANKTLSNNINKPAAKTN